MTGTDTSGDSVRINFRSPPKLAERVDALATVLEENRTDIITSALEMYIEEMIERDEVDRQIGAAFYDERISMDELVALVGPREAEGFQQLKQKLQQGPRDLPDPDESDTDVYGDDFEPETATPDR